MCEIASAIHSSSIGELEIIKICGSIFSELLLAEMQDIWRDTSNIDLSLGLAILIATTNPSIHPSASPIILQSFLNLQTKQSEASIHQQACRDSFPS